MACLCLTGSAFAASVVTDDDRAWAREALREERDLHVDASRNTVGVLYFENHSGDAALDPFQKGLSLMLVTDLSSVEGLEVVERVRLQALVEELGLGRSGLVEAETAPRVGRLLGARWLVSGAFSAPAAETLRVDAAVLEVPKNELLSLPPVDQKLSEFFAVEKQLLFEILERVQVRLTPEAEARLRRPCSRSTTALLALSRGVVASDAGDYEQAAVEYNRALWEDPGVCLAGEQLQELRTRRLLAAKASSREMLDSLRDSTSLTDRVTPQDQLRRQPPAGGTIRIPVEIRVEFPQ
ncbi:MAG TPA: CsgG/HfaB family protein [Deferrisomatales bacterium]|nr:CsgG/HfaB family protein [Deferrisomatales bacterium]